MASLQEQLQAARQGALLVAAPEWSTLVVTGPDRVQWLNGLVTCDLSKVAAGQAAYGLAVGQKGKIMADLVFVTEADRVVVALANSVREELGAWLDKHLIMEDAELAQGEHVVSFVHGPRSSEALSAARAAGAIGGTVDRTGLGGAIVVASPEGAAAVTAAIEKAGAIVGDAAGWDVLRHERFVPAFGVDFDATLYPQEASLEAVAVSFDKGCYLGQEVVYMLQNRGHVKRKLVPLRVDGADVPAKGETVAAASGDAVGEVTSAASSPTIGAPLAFAMVKLAHATAEADLRIGARAARVVPERV